MAARSISGGERWAYGQQSCRGKCDWAERDRVRVAAKARFEPSDPCFAAPRGRPHPCWRVARSLLQ